MILNKLTKLSVLAIILMTSACGGGGGGGDSSSNNTGVNNIGSNYMSRGLRFVHAVIDAKPLQLNVADKTFAPLRFGFTNYLSVGGSSFNVSLETYKQPSSSPSLDIDLGETKRGTLMYCGRLEKGNKTSKFIAHEKTEKGVTKVRLLHALFKADMLNISINGESVTASFCKDSKYIVLPDEVANIKISRVADGLTIYSDTVEFDSGNNYSIIAAGDADLDYKITIAKD